MNRNQTGIKRDLCPVTLQLSCFLLFSLLSEQFTNFELCETMTVTSSESSKLQPILLNLQAHFLGKMVSRQNPKVSLTLGELPILNAIQLMDYIDMRV